jgi:hypothetical protein
MEIFRPEFPCIDGNLAAKFVKDHAGFELLILCLASDRSSQLTVVTFENMDNFYLTPHHLYRHIHTSMGIFR